MYCLFIIALAYTLPTLKVANNRILDSSGREIIFHGVNAVYKEPPYIPTTDFWDPKNSLCDADMAKMQRWGINVVRLGTMWPGYNPSEGKYSTEYLQQIHTIVKRLGDYGIYTILDFHQDLISRYFCGEGMPDYLIKYVKSASTFPNPIMKSIGKEANGYPKLSECLSVSTFGVFYPTYSVIDTFIALYTTGSEINKEFHKFWAAIATEFKNEPNVLGYELINEPFNGNVYKNPFNEIIPGYAEKHMFYPFYKALHETIRAIDNQHIILFEGTVDLAGTGFPNTPGGNEYHDREIFSFHIYCPLVDADGVPESRAACNIFDSYMSYLRNKDIKKLGVAGLLTEFGAINDNPKSVEEINEMTSLMDKYMYGYVYWTYKSYHDITTANTKGSENYYWDDGLLQKDKVKALTRSYNRKTCGTLTSMSFSPKTGAFLSTYATKAYSVCQTTEIFIHQEYYYPRGFTISISPPLPYIHEGNIITVQHPSTIKEGQAIKIEITAS